MAFYVVDIIVTRYLLSWWPQVRVLPRPPCFQQVTKEMVPAPERLTEYRAILRGLCIENKSVTGTSAADHQPFALRVGTQF